jgi:hypothetical protein
MLNAFVWCLWPDHQLTTATPLNCKHLLHYLSIGEPAITHTTYLGAAIPGRFCPNFAYYFQVDGWPTDLLAPNTHGFLHEFEKLSMISLQAQQHDHILVNLHDPHSAASLPLQTKEHLYVNGHSHDGSIHSFPSKGTQSATTGGSRPEQANDTPLSPRLRKKLPSGVTAFSPSPPPSH